MAMVGQMTVVELTSLITSSIAAAQQNLAETLTASISAAVSERIMGKVNEIINDNVAEIVRDSTMYRRTADFWIM